MYGSYVIRRVIAARDDCTVYGVADTVRQTNAYTVIYTHKDFPNTITPDFSTAFLKVLTEQALNSTSKSRCNNRNSVEQL